MKRLLALVALSVAVAGCASTQPASVKGGECRVFERPRYSVLGRTSYDQQWIDGNVEAGVAACRWPRPEPRPERLDAQAGLPAPVVVRPATRTEKIKRLFRRKPAAPAKKVDRLAVPDVPPPAPAPVAATPPAPAAPPRSDIDELLDPRPRR